MEESLWRSLLETLGAGGDRAGFRRLAEAFPASLLWHLDAEVREAALLHVAGLGPQLEDVAHLPLPLKPALQGQGRPANRPQVRLAGLAALLRRAKGYRGASAEVGPLGQMAHVSVRRAYDAKALVAGWTASPQIGPSRAVELLVNAVLPFAASRGLEARALELAAALPAGSYGKTAFLETNLRPEKGRIARSALQSEGLLDFVARWCSQGGCGRCPLSRGDRQAAGTG